VGSISKLKIKNKNAKIDKTLAEITGASTFISHRLGVLHLMMHPVAKANLELEAGVDGKIKVK